VKSLELNARILRARQRRRDLIPTVQDFPIDCPALFESVRDDRGRDPSCQSVMIISFHFAHERSHPIILTANAATGPEARRADSKREPGCGPKSHISIVQAAGWGHLGDRGPRSWREPPEAKTSWAK
jgi:hypothetical protein